MRTKRRIDLYWIYWITLVVFLAIIKLTVRQISENEKILVLISFIFLIWFPLMIMNMIKGNEFLDYLKEHHYSMWSEFKINGYLFTNDNLTDNNLLEEKRAYKRFVIFQSVVFFSFPLLAIMYILI